MSVASPVIDRIDPDVNPRLIYLKAGVRSFHPVDDIYKEVRNLRRIDHTLRGYDPFVSAGGNVKKLADGSKRTPRYAVMINSKIVPDDISHDLVITGEQLFAPSVGSEPTGTGAAAIDKGPLSVGVGVNVDYAPPNAEVIIVASGSGLSTAEKAQLFKLWQRFGLDPDNPLEVTPTSIKAGDVNQVITGDGETTSTVTEQ